ncbi:DrsE family protein [Methylacidimicrobium sp. AP8]|uniref:DsrE family protein n=1 Tax=Methylacidimicrobium sp. AP8 TaxID=2730359 RepID=UPI0018C0E72A|nr:DsrE family protein [Methylacidimicrobium sp. AP8]CAB4243783.1 DrsE family protein [Methylacidimicrobium sp. AP8]
MSKSGVDPGGPAAASSKQALLIVVTTGKEAFPRANSLLHMAGVLANQPNTQVEFLLLGPGVELLRSNQKSPPIIAEALDHLRRCGVDITACEVSLEAYGVEADRMLPARLVKGAVEIRRCIGEGATVLTF